MAEHIRACRDVTNRGHNSASVLYYFFMSFPHFYFFGLFLNIAKEHFNVFKILILGEL